MATTTIKQRRADGAYDLILQLDYTQSITGNYSDVTWYLKLQSLVDGAAYKYNYGNSFYLELNGQVLLNTPNLCPIAFEGKELKQLASGTIRIPHNADGSKNLPCKVTFQQTQNLNYANYRIEQSVQLNKIPRATVPVLSVGSVKVGETVEIRVNPADSSFSHELKYKLGSVSGTIAHTNGRWLWTVPEVLVKEFTDKASEKVTITCVTKNGNSIVGSEPVVLEIRPADSMKPVITAIHVEEIANIPEEIVGFVKGKSKLRITVEATGYEGASVPGYRIVLNDKIFEKNEAESDVLTQAGKNIIKVRVSDSRSMVSEEVTREIDVADYFKPELSAVSAYRCVSMDDPTELSTGAFICVKFTRRVSEIGGSNKNICKVYYKKQTDTSDSPVSKPLVGYEAVNETIIFAADVNYSYDVKVELNDSFPEGGKKDLSVGSGFTLLNIRSTGKGIGIGKVAETEKLVDSAWKLHSDEGITSDGNITSLNGNVTAGSATYEGEVKMDLQTTLHHICTYISEDGNAGLYDSAHSKWVLYSTKNGAVVLPNNVSITGDLQNSNGSIIPVFSGSHKKGAIRFPNIKVQICWEWNDIKTSCDAAWGNGYETVKKFTFGNWTYPFSDVPTALRLMQGASNVGILTQSYDPVTKTNPGSVYGFRPSALATENTFRCVAIGIGKYA